MSSASLTGCLVFIATLFQHPIHVSVTEIEYDRKDQALEIMMRVFIDDLELSLREFHHEPGLDILNPGSGVTRDDLISPYVANHFKVTLDNKPHKATYLGHESEGEAFIFYLEVKNVKPWKTITIHNDVIMGTYDDQSNIVHVYVDDKVKSLRLTRNTPADQITFN